MFESGFVASQIVIQKLAEVNETRRHKIAPSRGRPRNLVKGNLRGVAPHREGRSTNPKPHVANDLPAKTLLQFPQDVDLRDLLEFVMQRRL